MSPDMRPFTVPRSYEPNRDRPLMGHPDIDKFCAKEPKSDSIICDICRRNIETPRQAVPESRTCICEVCGKEMEAPEYPLIGYPDICSEACYYLDRAKNGISDGFPHMRGVGAARAYIIEDLITNYRGYEHPVVKEYIESIYPKYLKDVEAFNKKWDLM